LVNRPNNFVGVDPMPSEVPAHGQSEIKTALESKV
jgi:hypothetical protein